MHELARLDETNLIIRQLQIAKCGREIPIVEEIDVRDPVEAQVERDQVADALERAEVNAMNSIVAED